MRTKLRNVKISYVNDGAKTNQWVSANATAHVAHA